ncbi:MAG: hypothetical protein ACP5JH_02430 [Bacteroidota bacterium]
MRFFGRVLLFFILFLGLAAVLSILFTGGTDYYPVHFGSFNAYFVWWIWLVPVILGLFVLFAFLEFAVTKGALADALAWFFEDSTLGDALKKLKRYLAHESGKRTGFARWMIEVMVRGYKNNVQGFAYAGAAFLIVMVGLRGIRFIPSDYPGLIVLALEIEFTLLLLLALLTYYEPEEVHETTGTRSLSDTEKELIDHYVKKSIEQELRQLSETLAEAHEAINRARRIIELSSRSR